jgi:hypothetical protein
MFSFLSNKISSFGDFEFFSLFLLNKLNKLHEIAADNLKIKVSEILGLVE